VAPRSLKEPALEAGRDGDETAGAAWATAGVELAWSWETNAAPLKPLKSMIGTISNIANFFEIFI
jgi:hypothetical protein